MCTISRVEHLTEGSEDTIKIHHGDWSADNTHVVDNGSWTEMSLRDFYTMYGLGPLPSKTSTVTTQSGWVTGNYVWIAVVLILLFIIVILIVRLSQKR